MTAPPRNLVNLKDVGKGFAARTVLSGVTLGVSAGDRVGIVGRNGDGKSTLLRLIGGVEEPDAGAVTRVGGLALSMLGQGDDLDSSSTVRDELVGGLADHEWAADARYRNVLDGLLGGVSMSRFPRGLDAPIAPLSGGERRRIALAKTLLGHPELLLLDEPTNHLDVEGVDWLAHHLAARRGSILVVTHDRWFLDAVCTHTWEVSDGDVHQYEGGYAAYVLARAERERQAAAREERRQQLIAQGARLAAPRPAGPDLQAQVPHRGRERADRRRARGPRPHRAAEVRLLAAGRQGHRGRARGSGLRREGAAARHELAHRPGRPDRPGRRERFGQVVLDPRSWPASWRPTRERSSAARPCGSRTCPRTPRRSRAGCACWRRSRRSAGSHGSATGAS